MKDSLNAVRDIQHPAFSRSIPSPGDSWLRRRTHIPKTASEKASPLHVKPVNKIDYDVLRELARGTGLEDRLDAMLRWNTTTEKYTGIIHQPYDEAPMSDVPFEFIQQLLEAGTIEETTKGDSIRYGSMFTVFEEAKNRQRIILWPKVVNALVDYESSFTLPGTETQARQIRDILWAVAFDLSASFFQCGLSPEVRRYFCVKTPHGVFRFTRMVMGFSPAAEIMHTILEVLAKRATLNSNTNGTVTTYIDNVRCGAQDFDTVSQWSKHFREACARVGVTLNIEDCNRPHQMGTFLGICFDYRASKVRLSDKAVRKLDHARARIHRPDLTFGDVFELFGLLFYASTILRHRIDYHTFKYYRKRAAAYSLHGDVNSSTSIWPCVVSPLQKWLSELIENKWTDPLRPVMTRTTLYTDASKTGFGAVLFSTDGGVHRFGGRWSPQESSRRIEELEAMAIERGLSYFAEQVTGRGLDLFIDNTSVRYCMRRGYSKSYNLDKRIKEIQDRLSALHIDDIVTVYVKSAENIADGLSRGTDPSQLPSVQGW
jgi:hypothetical protein